jgi:hypothetical protein
MIITEKNLNVQTGQETIIEREETADEKKARLALQTLKAEAEAEQVKNEQAKQVILDRLGITSDEAKLLLL